MKNLKINALKKRVWRVFARYIKARDADRHGIIKCCTCPKRLRWDDAQMHAGHFIGGRSNAVLFDETIVHGQCSGCNLFHGGRPWDYEQFMMKNYGLDYLTLEEVKARRNMVKRYTIGELLALEEMFKTETLRLIKEKKLNEQKRTGDR